MSIIAYNDCMNAIRTIGGSSGGNFPDRKRGNEATKPKTGREKTPTGKTAVQEAVQRTRAKIDGLGEHLDLDA